MYTVFWDMHSGGYKKGKYEVYIIEAFEPEARKILETIEPNLPLDRTACDCCGPNYSISEREDITSYLTEDYFLLNQSEMTQEQLNIQYPT